MKINQKSLMRIKNILKIDKEQLPKPLISLFKNDIYNVFCNYLYITPEDVNLNYMVDENGCYAFNVCLKTNRIKKINFLNI